MRRPSWLDSMLERFQHSWETNPQFRAIWSGGAGLVIIVGLCATMGVAATFANAIGGTLGGGDSNTFVSKSGPNAQATDVVFPMTTLTAWPTPNIPGATTIPASQTPAPTPTLAPTPTPSPTATPCITGCGGGGGGGGGGAPDKITVTVSPATFINGTDVVANIHTSFPSEGFSIFTYWPNGNYIIQRTGMVDGNGNGSLDLGKIPGGCPGGNLKLWVTTQNNGTGVTVLFPC